MVMDRHYRLWEGDEGRYFFAISGGKDYFAFGSGKIVGSIPGPMEILRLLAVGAVPGSRVSEGFGRLYAERFSKFVDKRDRASTPVLDKIE